MLCLYDDHDMPKFSRMMTAGSLCQERARICTWQTRIRPADTAADKHHFTFASGVSNRRDVKSAHYWYAVLMDCYLEEYDAHPPRLHYALQFLNGNPNSLQSSHLPADENGMQTINALALAAMVAYGAIFGMRLYTRWLNIQQAHLIVVLFMAAYVLQALSLLCELCHLRRYASDGKGLRWRHTWLALDFGGALLQSLSELILSVLLIALAFGWTLGFQKVPIDGLFGKAVAGLQSPADLLKGMRSRSLLLLGALASVQLLLHAIGRSYEEDFGMYHDHEHWPGMALIAIRVASWALFSWALLRSRKAEANPEVLGFLGQLWIFGTVWFVSFPQLVALATLVPTYRRHQLVAGGSIAMQTIALALLSTLFMTQSNYYRISSLAHLGSVFEKGFGSGRSKLAVD